MSTTAETPPAEPTVDQARTLDPSQWFEKFHPTYLFDKPKQAKYGSGSWLVLAEQEVEFSEEVFWKVIDRWTNEAHLVIPPLSGVEIVSETTSEAPDPTASVKTIIRRLIPKRKDKDREMEERVEYFQDADVSRVVYTPMLEQASDTSNPAASLPFYYPKVKSFGYSYVESGIGGNRERYLNDDEGDDDEGDECSHQSLIRLEILPFPSTDPFLPTDKMRYALTQLFHKLYKWCVAEVIGYRKQAHHDIMVPKEAYAATYAKLKDKYVEKWVRDWPEKTDPRKFVFEDIAIASFLISLWEMDRDKVYSDRKPTFVDLGCGNGLLTHILTCEGYDGVGIDLARRKVWNAFEAEEVGTRLVAETLHPPTARYPEADWLIGNHADELVPWIPIIAARSSPTCKFVVIPCCFHSLSGAKFRFGATAIGQGKYRAYVDHIRDLASQCGFRVEEENLRIPSTKNVTVVGRRRLRTWDEVEEEIGNIVAEAGTFVARMSDREKGERRRGKKYGEGDGEKKR